jgi:uncharacterized membrane protein
VFFLLTGTGAHLALARRGRAGLSRFLVTRGLWLIVLELTVVRFFWQFNVDYRVTILNVLWALGWSMIVLGALAWLPTWLVAAFGVLLVAAHDLFDGVRPASLGGFAPLWTILHSPGVLWSSDAHTVFVAYPLVPWIGVTAVGYALGAVFTWPAERRRALLLRLGLGLIGAFVVLRAVNHYGDPGPWTRQRSGLFTLLSFLNVNKYPPSLLFLLMTLGVALLLLRLVDEGTPRLLRPAAVIGKVPLFYYLLHIPLMHLVAVVACWMRFGTARPMFESPSVDRFPVTQPPGWPVALPIVYLVWVGVVLALYPLCRWYAALKQRRRDPWLSYL